MPRRRRPLKDYIKAVQILAAKKKLRVEVYQGNKNAIRFEVFQGDNQEPWEMWTIHTEHSKRKEIWSPEDYKKPDLHLSAESGEFVKILDSI